VSPDTITATATTPGQASDGRVAVGQVFASHAGVALKGAINEAGLEQAIQTRDVIGQAKGILIERLPLSGNEAFELLVGISQHQNTPCATSPSKWSPPTKSHATTDPSWDDRGGSRGHVGPVVPVDGDERPFVSPPDRPR
jgi:hypothetical protein